jgi:hypothetical protein
MKSLFIRFPQTLFAAFCVIVFVQSSCFSISVFGEDQVTGSERVDFFAAMKSGQIDVTLTQSSSLNGRVTIKNKTKKTLLLQLPSTFAGVPYNAQDGAYPISDPIPSTGGSSSTTDTSSSTSTSRSQNQSVGGGFGNNSYGGGYGNRGGGGGYFSLPPEKIVRHDVKTICLEYGKKEPRSSIKYRMLPLDNFTDKPEVGVLCSLIASGSVDQWSAQAAVWHYSNNISWNELATKRIKPRIDAMYRVPLFTPQQINYAINLSKQVESTVIRGNQTPKITKSKPQVFKPVGEE